MSSTDMAYVRAVVGDAAKANSHREIDRRYAGKGPKTSARVWMLRNLCKFFGDRYDKHGPAMPEGCDAALDDFFVLLNYTAMLGDYRALLACKARWAPWLDDGRIQPALSHA
jgi:hypothetical protein